MENATSNLEAISERIRASFAAKDASREKALRMCREVIRNSALAIRAIHRGEFDNGQSHLDDAQQLLKDIRETLTPYNELASAGFVHDCQKEFAEGSITMALVTGKMLPEPENLGVNYPAYLNGLGEAVGELRRYLLDSIRKGDLAYCEEILSHMDAMYSTMVTIDFPDALTGGLRRTTDVVRGILEKTRSELTLIVRQQKLEQRLEEILSQPK